MREVKKFDIGGIQYNITPMPPMVASKILVELLKIVGAPLAKMMAGKKDDKSLLDQEVDGPLISEAVLALTERLETDQVESLILRLLKPEFVSFQNPNTGEFEKIKAPNSHFGEYGSLGTMFKLLRHVLEVNYKDFLRDLVGQ